MKWILLTTVCAYFVFASFAVSEDIPSKDAVVSLVLSHPSDNSFRQKREEVVETVDLSSRGGHRRRNKYRGGSNGAQQYPNYPTGFGGNPGSQTGSWSSSNSQSWANGGLTNSQSNSQSGASSLGHGGSGTSSSSNAGSNAWGGNGASGSESKSDAQAQAHGGNTAANSNSESKAQAQGFQFPGQYQ